LLTAKKTIVIVEDHTIIRDGLKALLITSPALEIVGEAEDGLEAIQCLAKLNPDLVLMDLSMPRMNGVEAIRAIRAKSSKVKVLVLTVHKTEEHVLESLRAGADGYVLKEASHSELLLAIINVLNGKRYLSPAISEKVIEGYLEGKKKNLPLSPWDTLTAREREIIKLIAENFKNKEMAKLLCISPKTVAKHRDNLMKKLDLHSASALTALAIAKGIIVK
jgi:two-component system, NarL family, response regulator NreC